ncbi:MAG: GNAT family N-acetyltransferase [Planctomycetaceae bacterium]|nr:GNAT family N-acetyltransferase [Planctomycetaceae bacterium]
MAHAFRSPIGTNYLRELQGSGGNRAEFEEARERCFELAASDPEAFFRSIRTLALGYDLPPNRVQQDEYWLFANDRIFGSCRIRHRLIAMTELDRGHIAYEIRPSARRQGYGTAILRLALTKARLLDLDRVLLTTHPSNHGSIRVIEKNGGEFQDECLSPFTGETVHRYWISL